jgi:hypothetical protein
VPISPEDILARYHERKQSRGRIITRMEEIQKFVNGDVVVPLPELDKVEKSAIPNLIEQGLAQMAQRIASVSPDQSWPALRPGIDRSEELARQRRLAALGWWDMNRMDMVTRQRSRYLLGYGTTPIMVTPVSADLGDKRDIPHWQIANPLHVFPSPPAFEGDIRPSDVIVSSVRPLWWLTRAYPDQMGVLAKGKATPDTEFELLAYNDGDESVLVVCGQASTDEARDRFGDVRPGNGGAPYQLLERAPNRAGKCLWVMPYRIALDRVMGHFDSITGMYMRQAKLDALLTIGITRAIYPDEWLISHPNAPMKPKIIVPADGRKGIMGEVENGMIQVIDAQPPQATTAAIANLERSQRVTAGIPSDFGGESATNIRTARRGDQVLGATVDMPIMEYQEILANSNEAELEIGVAVMKGCFGSAPTSFYIPRSGKVGPYSDYTPNEAFETDMVFVKYSMPGADANELVIALGQRVGFGEMSIQTAQEMDPAIEDPVRERNQIVNEGLRKALLQSLETAATQPGYDPSIIARIAVEHAKAPTRQLEDIYLDIYNQEQAKAAQTQAAQAAQGQAGPPGAPPTVPGGAPPGALPPGGPPPAIGPAPASQTDLSSILQTLRRPQNQGPAEKAAAAAVAQ